MQPIRDSNVSTGIDIGLGGLAPILVAAALVAVRGDVQNANIALILAVVVVLAGAFGGRVAGMVAGVMAAVSFDFFHTKPYLSLVIHDADDVEMTILLLVLGFVAGWIGWKSRVAAHQRDGGRGELDLIRRLADQVAQGV